MITVRDLAASRAFYTDVVGLIVSDEDSDVVYLRGLEEACHHSLVLKQAAGPARCERVGFRVFREEDLDKAAAFYRNAGLPAEFVQTPHQGRTLHVSDPAGMPLNSARPWMSKSGWSPHFRASRAVARTGSTTTRSSCRTCRPALTSTWRRAFACRNTSWPTAATSSRGVFLQRKGNPHDLVLFNGHGPRIHHFAFTSVDVATLMRACDIAGNLGFGNKVERGPGRHGPGHAQFVYFRDPDGHRVELFTTHYQMMDIENEPVRWDANSKLRKETWGLPPQRSWVEDATEFPASRCSRPRSRTTR